MEDGVCSSSCGVCPRCRIDAAVAAGAGEVRRRTAAAVRRQVIVDAARAAAAAGGSLAGVAHELGKSEAAVSRALERAGEAALLSRLRPRGRVRLGQAAAGPADVTRSRPTGHGYVGAGRAVGGRWLPTPDGPRLEAWRAARAARAAREARASAGARPSAVLPVTAAVQELVVLSDPVLDALAEQESRLARKPRQR